MSKQKKTRRVGRPNRFIIWLLMVFLYPWYRLRYGVRIDRTALRGLRGPALILSPHICGKDHFLLLLALWRYCPNYVASAHLWTKPWLGWLLSRLHVIPKKMFCADIRAIREILRAKEEGNVIVLFPEGRLSACGHSLAVADGTAELVKRLGIPVYCVTSDGGYLTFPKWGKVRRGRIRITASSLFTREELSGLSLEEVRARINAAVLHDDERAMAGVRYRTRDTTAGLDGLLRRCPVCRRVGDMTAGGGHIRCRCGMDAVLDEYWRLHGVRFHRVNEWFDWQQAEIDPTVDALTNDVMLGTTEARGRMVKDAGRGRLTLDHDVLCYRGTLFGEETILEVPTGTIGALPVTPSDHFDLFIAGRMYHFTPLPDRRAAIDYVMYIDRVHEQKEAETGK